VRSRLIKYIFNKAIVIFTALRLKFLPKHANVYYRGVGIITLVSAILLSVGRDGVTFYTLGLGAVSFFSDHDIRVHLLASEVLEAHKSDIGILSFLAKITKAFDFSQAFQFLLPFKRKIK
jgi:hypothetical protein